MDIAALVKFMSEVTGKNFILDHRVHGKLTIISPAKMSIDEAYQAFQSALQLKGFTTVVGPENSRAPRQGRICGR